MILRFSKIVPKILVLQGADFFFKDGSGARGQKVKTYESGFRHDNRGPSNQTLNDWISGKPAKENSILELVEMLKSKIYGCEDISIEHFSDKTTLHNFLLALGRTDEEAEIEAFTAWFESHGWLTDFTFSSRDWAENSFNEYGGLYHVDRFGGDPGASDRTRLGLAVRCIAPVGFRRNKERYAIGCSLSVPSRSGNTHYHYHGCFSDVYRIPHWLFFQENSQTRDLIMFLSERSDVHVESPIKGDLVTTSVGPFFKPSSHHIEIIKMAEIGTYSDTENFLKTSPRTLD